MRLFLIYERMNETKPSSQGAHRAEVIGVPKTHYTGIVDSVTLSKENETILTMLVQVERDFEYRSFNLNRGKVYEIRIL